jgi:hypothetical protein
VGIRTSLESSTAYRKMSASARASIFSRKKSKMNFVVAKLCQKIDQLQRKHSINLKKVPNLFGTCPYVQGEAPA